MPVKFSGSAFNLRSRGREAADRVAADVMLQSFDRGFQEAKRLWPVDTGVSKAELSIQHRAVPGRVSSKFRGKAPHTLFIRDGRTWQTLVVQHGMAVLLQIPRAIGEGILRELARGQ